MTQVEELVHFAKDNTPDTETEEIVRAQSSYPDISIRQPIEIDEEGF
ncbi:hypothetical protein HNR44_001711 [Geomicrobium halophilum]|uniref:Uncharacterized protein n=1 Tax=Geomicrobium halophilum TaxID=549000 RepID=A0A841PYI7_9BACL|nr:hypothetical protein [Geomicrobium halophilum]MBB6449733.1 hypothetical protein [Geomicrobium halophilum]